MATNQTSTISPNTEPTPEAPLNWMAKSAMRSPSVIGMTAPEKLGTATPSPSTAESTLIAGVIMPSPIRRPAPAISAQSSMRARRSVRSCRRP